MAIITIASTKGGCGKTTTAINLAIEARQRGYSAAVVDADPQHHAFNWVMFHQGLTAEQAAANTVYTGQMDIDVVCKVTADSVSPQILSLAATHDIVLVDLQGSANQTMIFAFAASDLVIVPAQPSAFDIGGAELTIRSLRATERSMRLGRTIPERILLTRTPAMLRTRSGAATRSAFVDAGLAVMSTEFVERTAFRDQTFTGNAPTVADPNGNAAKNIAAIFGEVLSIISESGVAGAAAE